MYKGIALHAIGKIAFVLGSYVLHLYLGRVLSPSVYGIVGTIIMIINFDYLFLNNGVRQAISKTISQDCFHDADTIKKGFLFQGALVLALFAINYFGADPIAQFLNDPGMADYIRMAAFIIPFMGIYFAALGVFNGKKLFVIEATIVIIYPILKLTSLPFVQFNTFGDAVIGTEMGFLLAGVAVFAISLLFMVKIRGKYVSNRPRVETKGYIKTAISFSILFAIASVIMNLDTLILKALTPNNEIVGFYTGAVTCGKVPFYFIQAVFLVILPIVTGYYAQKKIEEARKSIQEVLLLTIALVLPMSLIVSASAPNLLVSFYKEGFEAASGALIYLILGSFCLGMLIMFGNILSAANKKKFVNWFSLIILVAFALVCWWLTAAYSMSGTGMASLLVCSVGMLVAMIATARVFGNYWSKKLTVTVLLNIALFVAVKIGFQYYHSTNLLTIIFVYAAIYAGYLILLQAFKVVSVKKIKDMLLKKKAA